MSPAVQYYLWATFFVVAVAASWVTNCFSLPGNWFALGCAALFAWLLPVTESRGIGWWTVAVVAGLCVAGELIEFGAGAAGAAKHGASRRSIVLAMLGTVVGSVIGAGIGVPVFLVGPLIGALGGGALGAFIGAYMGESWKGRSPAQTMAVSKGALVGRVLGTLGKLAVGVVIVVVLTFDAYFF